MKKQRNRYRYICVYNRDGFDFIFTSRRWLKEAECHEIGKTLIQELGKENYHFSEFAYS